MDFEEQDQIISIYLSFTECVLFICLPIHIFGLYCVFCQSPHFHKNFRNALGVHVFLSFFETIYNLAMRQSVYIPIIGIFADGILSNFFNIHAFIQIAGLILIVELNSSVLVHIALLRLKLIIPITHRCYDAVMIVGKLILVLVYSLTLISTVGFLLLYEDQVEAKIYYQQKLSTLPKDFWHSNYIVSTGRSENFKIFILVGVMFLLIHCLIGVILLTAAYYILHRTKHRMSEKVLAAQRSYIHMLFYRILIMVVLNIIPYGMFAAAMSSQMTNPYVISLSLCFFSMYGTASTLSLILSTKPYRKILFTCSRKLNEAVIRDTIDHNSHAVADSTLQIKGDN